MQDTTFAVGNALVRAWFPNATDVFLLGEFNNWSTTATPLRHRGQGRWEVTVSVDTQASRLSAFVLERGSRFGRVMDLIDEPCLDATLAQEADAGKAAGQAGSTAASETASGEYA